MPELPEVETARRGIEPHLRGRRVTAVVVRQPRLRWPVPPALARELPGQTLQSVERRAKYLLLRCQRGTVLLHLGMSGSLQILSRPRLPRPHDHVDIEFAGGLCLRLHDPRRFGALLWTRTDPLVHPLLAELGPEPLAPDFNGAVLRQRAGRRRSSVKAFLVDGRNVAGVGNIYANEALFRAGIRPGRAAGRITAREFERLARAIQEVLAEAVAAGGTTLRDFRDSDGEPGRFSIRLEVYGRAGEPCRKCGGTLSGTRQAQRSTVFCRRCQH